MRDSMREAVLGTIKDLHQSGLVDEETLTRMENLCVPNLKEYSAAAIVQLRRKYHLNQLTFAGHLNISPGTLRQWETGVTKPQGPALKLLNLLERNGLKGIL